MRLAVHFTAYCKPLAQTLTDSWPTYSTCLLICATAAVIVAATIMNPETTAIYDAASAIIAP